MELIAYTIILIVSIIFFIGLVNGAKSYVLGNIPYVPSKNEVIESMIKLADFKDGEKVVDLGSGDGRVVVAFAKDNPNLKIYGYEINIILTYISKLLIFTKFGSNNNIKIEHGNFLEKDLSIFDTLVVYGIDSIMPKLEEKLSRECMHKKVISNNFTFPNKKPVKSIKNVHLYKF